MIDYRIIELPPFKAVVSGVDPAIDFSGEGVLGRFMRYFSKLEAQPQDSFAPRDYLYYDEKYGGMVWMYALTDGMDAGGYETIDFDGGYYVTYHYKDGDHAANERLYQAVLAWLEQSDVLTLDKRENHYPMGHIITPQAVIDAQGWGQMEAFVPVKLVANDNAQD